MTSTSHGILPCQQKGSFASQPVNELVFERQDCWHIVGERNQSGREVNCPKICCREHAYTRSIESVVKCVHQDTRQPTDPFHVPVKAEFEFSEARQRFDMLLNEPVSQRAADMQGGDRSALIEDQVSQEEDLDTSV